MIAGDVLFTIDLFGSYSDSWHMKKMIGQNRWYEQNTQPIRGGSAVGVR